MKRHNIIGLVLVFVVIAGGIWWAHIKSAELPQKASSDTQTVKNDTKSPASSSFNKKQYSTDDPTSIWIVVNKQRPLSPINYVPSDLVVPNIPLRLGASDGEMHLRKATATAMEQMVSAAKRQGVNFMLASGYRSYTLQVTVYGNEVRNFGQAVADSESARPGYSEHQTGFAADLEPASRQCEVQDCFADTPEGKWLAAHAYEYGFILRYQKDKEDITGYRAESWHVRYIGTVLSLEMHKQNIATLEEFFNLPGGKAYKSSN